MRLLLAVLLVAAGMFAGEAEKLASQAAEAARKGEFVRAFVLYSQAAQHSPYSTYGLQSKAMLTEARLRKQVGVRTSEAELEDEDLSDFITDEDLEETRRLLPPPALVAANTRRTVTERGQTKQLWETVLEPYGLDVVFDESVRESQPVRLELSEADYREAIRMLELATNTVAFPVSETLLLVAENNQSTITLREPTAAVAVRIPQSIQTEDAQEIANVIRQTLEMRAVMVDASRRLLLMRDRYPKVILAEALVEELMAFPQDVIFDVEFREVTKRSLNRYGINWPTTLPMALFSTWLNNVTNPVKNLGYLAFGGGNSLMGIGLSAVEAVAFMSRSDSKTLYKAQIRSNSGREAKLNLGQDYPILQASFFTGPTTEPNNAAFFPQVNYTQLGFSATVKPVVAGNAVTLDLSLTVALLTGESSNGIPVLANRDIQTRVQLQDGQMISVAGLLRKEEAHNLSGLAGLARVPGIGALFRQTSTTNEESELLITITPHIVHGGREKSSSRSYWSGTSTRFLPPL